MKFKKIMSILLISSLLTFSFVACDNKDSSESNNGQTLSQQTESNNDTKEMFTNRDYEIGYDSENATKITLKDDKTTVNGNGAKADKSTVTISEEGTYIVSGTLTNGQIVVNADKTAKLQIVFDNVNMSNDTTAPIFVKQADKVFITMATDSNNVLTTKEAFAENEYNIDSVIFSKEDLTINGNGKLEINSPNGNGITSKDDLVITSGEYNITAGNNGLEGKDSIRIASGTFNITATNDGIKSKNTDDTTLGFVYIDNGTFNLKSESDAIHSTNYVTINAGSFEIDAADDAIHAEESLLVNDGTINITNCYEGLEGHNIEVKNGDINIVSSDDAINASMPSTTTTTTTNTATNDKNTDKNSNTNNNTNTNSNDKNFDNKMNMNKGQGPGMSASDDDTYVKISGGKITIKTEGDGLDSNGNLYVEGGEVYVIGPTRSGNGALDYDGEGTITGGTILAVDAGGMAQNFTDSSTQCSMLVSTSAIRSGEITLKDESGNVLFSYDPGISYNSVVLSTSSIETGKTYTITMGTETKTVKQESTIYGESNGFGFHGGGGQRPNRDDKFPNGQQPDQSQQPNQNQQMTPPQQGNTDQQGNSNQQNQDNSAGDVDL